MFPARSDSASAAPILSRSQFLRGTAGHLAALSLLAAIPQPVSWAADAGTSRSVKLRLDLREFVRWITTDFEPSVRLPGGAGHYARAPGQTVLELYGVADFACILYSIGLLRPTEKERGEWLAAFQTFQTPRTGWLVEKDPTHTPLHNTAFALAAMQLLDLSPARPPQFGPEYSNIRGFLNSLDWHSAVYGDSHKGAGIGAIYSFIPELGTPEWFDRYFLFCDTLFDPRNGLMGRDKPPGGDFDQIGGTFHYSFLYSHFNRQMPFPEKRIDSILALQQPDGYWHPENHLWLTLDAVYLMTRTLRYCPHRFEEVQTCLRRLMTVLERDVYSAEGRQKTFHGKLAAHSLTAAVSIAAEVQQFLGAEEIVTERPLKLVLDRRPFI